MYTETLKVNKYYFLEEPSSPTSKISQKKDYKGQFVKKTT